MSNSRLIEPMHFQHGFFIRGTNLKVLNRDAKSLQRGIEGFLYCTVAPNYPGGDRRNGVLSAAKICFEVAMQSASQVAMYTAGNRCHRLLPFLRGLPSLFL